MILRDGNATLQAEAATTDLACSHPAKPLDDFVPPPVFRHAFYIAKGVAEIGGAGSAQELDGAVLHVQDDQGAYVGRS